jgi:hypothetical protein
MNWKFDFSPETSDIFAVLAVPWFVGRSLVISARARCCEVRERRRRILQRLGVCVRAGTTESGTSRPRDD